MKNYKIQILEDAKEDIKEIIAYIKNKLKEPEIAKQHKKAFKDAIKELKDTASIYNVIDEETIEIKNIRKINVKNFMIFYRIIDNENIVQIIAVYYAKSNWRDKLKLR